MPVSAAYFRAAMKLRLKMVTTAAVVALSAPAFAQYAPMTEGDAVLRVEQLENRLRQLTGENEQLQHRLRQLEEQLRAQGGGPAAGSAGRAGPGPGAAMTPQRAPTQEPEYQRQAYPQQDYQQGYPQQGYPQQPSYQPPVYQQQSQPQPQQAAPQGGRRGDAFDPSANPGAPGVPRPLGSIVGQPSAPERTDVGAPGGRAAGEPLDLGHMNQRGAGASQMSSPGMMPRGPEQVVATAAPSQTPRDEFDLGYGYIQRKDYALAEEALRGFLKKYPNDRMVADAQYWVGESLFQRQRYRDAAESFLTVTTKFDTATRAPDALLRLGQSLAALKEKEAACAAFGEVTRKYPRASGGVKQGVDREQKRNGC